MTAAKKLKIGVQGGNGRVGSVVANTLRPFYDVIAADTIYTGEGSSDDEFFAVINAAPYHTCAVLALQCINAGAHYLDLTEDMDVARRLQGMAQNASTAVIPQCGLAPGLVSIVAGSMVKKYDKLQSLKLRVGGLPRFPVNSLGYSQTWNVEGLINQYTKPAKAISNGFYVEAPALGDVERYLYEGGEYEAFNTSGGIGTLCESFGTNAECINYKTIRYPGHAKMINLLMNELRIPRDQLQKILEDGLPHTDQDVVLIGVTSSGWKDGRLSHATYSKQVFGLPGRSALQATTASSVCTVLDMLAAGTLKASGYVKQEEIPIEGFMSNRFGRLFAT